MLNPRRNHHNQEIIDPINDDEDMRIISTPNKLCSCELEQITNIMLAFFLSNHSWSSAEHNRP
jgi:hypothetical protein